MATTSTQTGLVLFSPDEVCVKFISLLNVAADLESITPFIDLAVVSDLHTGNAAAASHTRAVNGAMLNGKRVS